MRTKTITLGLQGGGAHGAFTWGVLDRLLEERRIHIEGISGTSAGAMNAVALAHGMLENGPEGARQSLAKFWDSLARKLRLAPCQFNLLHQFPGADRSPAFAALLTLGWFLSPYQFNPLAFDPLRELVEEVIDFERLRRESKIKLFIAATRVRTGKIRIFRNAELSADALLASACLPSLHHTVEIDGEPYWDGAYSGNPAIFPLLQHCNSNDVLVVLLTPLLRSEHPVTAEAIRNRASELGFSATFLREMRTLADAKAELGRRIFHLGRAERRLRKMRFHLIEADGLMNRLNHHSKFNTHPSFLAMLRDEGRETAGRWLDSGFDAIGHKATVDLMRLFG